jgi:hypothetical protein
MEEFRIYPVARVHLWHEPRAWPWAQANRSAIGAHLAKLRVKRPALFNGRLYLLHDWEVADSSFKGSLFEADFASFLAWRDAGYPDATIAHCFGMAALRTSDGVHVLGLKAAHKTRSGSIDFAIGTPESRDLKPGSVVEITPSMLRKLKQQTGLTEDDVRLIPGWHAVVAGRRIALVKSMIMSERALAATERIRHHISLQRPPEIADAVLVRRSTDMQLAIADIARAFLTEVVLARRVSA